MKSSDKIKLTCQDHIVSKAYFDLIIDDDLEMLITSPRPKEEDLPNYYESEAYISHTDSSKSFIDKIYQLVKNYTILQKIKLINSFNTESKTILDIGSGTGDFLVACKNNGWQVIGIEPNDKARNFALQKMNLSNSIQNPFFTSVEELIEKEINKKFDIITMWHVLEHVPNLENYIIHLEKLLKPKGRLIIAVPNYKSHDAKFYGRFWAAFDVPRHLWHFSQNSIKLIFLRIGMVVENIIPMKFDAYYVSLLSEKYKNGFSNPIKAFYRGFISNFKAFKSKEYSSLIYILKKSK